MNAILRPATESLPASRKLYQPGRLHPDILVPMREISLHPSAHEPPLRVYDSSGPYTDPLVSVDIARGLARLREAWIARRDDTDAYPGRAVHPLDNGLSEAGAGAAAHEFPLRHAPRRARAGAAVTQLAYARAGIITPEMEFIAIRENLGREPQRAKSCSAMDTPGAREHPRLRHARVRAR